LNVRRNIYSLSPAELADWQAAVNALKTDGSYDNFIIRHHHSMMTPTLMPGESGGSSYRNVAHRGPAFLPWHRYFVREFELMLQTKKPNVTMPYWNWAADASNPLAAPLWNTNAAAGPIYVGGDGTGPDSVVTTGPFAGWTALIESGSGFVPRPGGIIRELGSNADGGSPIFPTPVQVEDAITNYGTYDTDPWRTVSAGSFRNRLEGWLGVAPESGSQLHNRVHIWIGGDMGPGTSPNDPVFFLHHCNIDHLWARWQYAHPAAPYAPAANGPPGHNLNDTMQFLTSANPTPANSLDYRRTLGYIYDTDPPLVELPEPTLNFQDVPTLETTWRAAVFHVIAGGPVHFEIVAGTEPTPPYSLTALGGSVTHTPVIDNAPFDPVRVWFAFTGAAAPGPAPEQTVQIRCVETNEVFDVTLKANTVARPTTGVVFCLDKSGSMSEPAGSGPTRIEVLHEAASRCVQLMRDGSGAGLVSFDQDAYPGIALAPFDAATTQRADVVAQIAALAPGGNTSIGDGVALARQTLLAGAAAFDGQALVVLTDGLENSPQFLSQVLGSIDNRTFAIGLGNAQQVSSGALTTLAHGTGGYLLLTGQLTPDTDGYFRLSKYFQQILVTATNDHIVTDPSGYVAPGSTVRIPFNLTEADIDATAVVLLDVPAVRMAVETPSGDRLDEGDLLALGAQVERGTNMTFCRFGVPLAVGTGAHGGTWYVLLDIDRARWRRVAAALERVADDQRNVDIERRQAHGVRYSVTVSVWSNVRLQATLTQSSLEPDAELQLAATLTEYGLPVAGRAAVSAEITRPDGFTSTVVLDEREPGMFETSWRAGVEGVWRLRVQARGRTYRGGYFTREQLLTAAIVRGGDQPQLPGERDRLECLLRCVAGDEGARRFFEQYGIDPERLVHCLRRCAKDRGFDGGEVG
jgi:hypothetical protein